MKFSYFISCILLFFLSSCASVKPWEKVYLNQEEMKLQPSAEENFEINAESYREGSSGGNGIKTGGGCGCY